GGERRPPARPGSHQFLAPSSSMVAGTSSMRISVASSRTATARPKPNILRTRLSSTMNEPNTTTMMAAAARRAGASQSAGHGLDGIVGSDVLRPHPGEQEHLVVHRQAEDDGEQDHGDERFDGGGGDAQESR